MLDGVLEENQFDLFGEGHVVVIQVVLEDSLDLHHVRQVLVQAVFLVDTHLQGGAAGCKGRCLSAALLKIRIRDVLP